MNIMIHSLHVQVTSFLEIKAANNGDIRFVLNGLFETDVARDEKIPEFYSQT